MSAQDGPPPSGGGGNPTVDFHGEKRSNDTHASTTDPEARLYRKTSGVETKLCFLGHALMENRNGLVVRAQVTQATGYAERDAAVSMITAFPISRRVTLGGDKAYDTRDFVSNLRVMRITPQHKLSVEAERGTEVHQVTEAEVVYVGIDPTSPERRPVPLLPGT